MSSACPFTIAIDSQEKQPFTFAGMRRDGGPCNVATQWKSLGVSGADYSIIGLEDSVRVERKSLDDAHGTILGWGERRERFMRELEFLTTLKTAAVVVEASIEQLISEAPQWGKKSAQENARVLFSQVLAWQQDYRVPWVFAGSRRLAEIATFRILDRHWRNSRQMTPPAGTDESGRSDR